VFYYVILDSGHQAVKRAPLDEQAPMAEPSKRQSAWN
jgi:hypothetical protein